MRAKFNFIAGSYTENKVLKTRMNISGGTGYRTITASDVNNHQIAVEMVGLALSILATPNAANAGCRKSGASHFFDSLASLGRGPSAPCPRDGLSKGKAAGGRFSLRQTLPPPRRPLGPPAALRMFTFGKWQYPWGCDINKGNHRRDGAFGICRKAPAHKEEKHP